MDEYDYPVGGPCGWMWMRKKEKILAQDFNPSEPRNEDGRWTILGSQLAALKAGTGGKSSARQKEDDNTHTFSADFPDKSGSHFTSKKDGRNNYPVETGHSSSQQDKNKSYLRDAIYPAPDLFDLPVSPMADWKYLKEAYGFSKETLFWLEDYFSRQASQKALAGASGRMLKEGENLSRIFEKRGNKNLGTTKKLKPPETEEEFLERIPSKVDLLDEEKAGGHSHQFHTSEHKARARMHNDPDLPASSYYRHVREGNSVTSKIIWLSRHEIARKLANGATKFPITRKLKNPVGYILRRGKKTTILEPEPTHQAMIIIRKDSSTPKGFRVQSSFPTDEK